MSYNKNFSSHGTQSKRKIPCGEIAKILIGVIGAAGIVVVAVAAPNALQCLPAFARRRYARKSVDQAFRRLERRGFVRLEQGVRGKRIELTPKGHEVFLRLQIIERQRKHKRWDKKWRLLVFDIPENRRKTRDGVRHTLRALGFYRLQDSVWIYPYGCDDVLELLRVKYHVRHDALILCATRFPKDGELCRHFGLKIQ